VHQITEPEYSGFHVNNDRLYCIRIIIAPSFMTHDQQVDGSTTNELFESHKRKSAVRGDDDNNIGVPL
jgi:hypothetical protein